MNSRNHRGLSPVRVLVVIVIGVVATFCLGSCGSIIDSAIDHYAADKEQCRLNEQDITQFTCGSTSYTLLQKTTSTDNIYTWTGIIRKTAFLSSDDHLISLEESKGPISAIKDLGDKATDPTVKYSVVFWNVYALDKDRSAMAVDVGSNIHVAVPTQTNIDKESVLNLKTVENSLRDEKDSQNKSDSEFSIDANNATQLNSNSTHYHITDQSIDQGKIGKYLDSINQNITYRSDTGKILSPEELRKIYWYGGDIPDRTYVEYGNIYEISGHALSEMIAVEVNDEYRIAQAIR